MSLQAHLVALEQRHKTIERRIADVAVHPSASELELAELKRKKLQLKDEIARLKAERPARTMN